MLYYKGNSGPAASVDYAGMTRRTALMIGLAAPSWAYSKEFWNEKKPSDWTSEEIEMLLNKSPWAKAAAISYYGGQNGPMSSTLPGTRSRRSSSASNTSSPSAQSPAAWKAIVRWESALPVREALKQSRPDIEKYYILNLIGDVPSGGAEPESFEMLKQATKLEHKGDAILLSRVAVAPKSVLSLAGTLFYFSRDLALRPEDKQATFSTKLGPIDVKCKFTLKDMIVRGNLEL
jgi:hypothetical protein